MSARCYNVANHHALLNRDERQLRKPTSIVSQPRDQRRFAWIPSWLHRRCTVCHTPERGGRDRSNRCGIVRELTSNHHSGTLRPMLPSVKRVSQRPRPAGASLSRRTSVKRPLATSRS